MHITTKTIRQTWHDPGSGSVTWGHWDEINMHFFWRRVYVIYSAFTNFAEWFFSNIFVTVCHSHMEYSALNFFRIKIVMLNVLHLFHDLHLWFRTYPWILGLPGPSPIYISHNHNEKYLFNHLRVLDGNGRWIQMN